jgi:hypothetical protein
MFLYKIINRKFIQMLVDINIDSGHIGDMSFPRRLGASLVHESQAEAGVSTLNCHV